MFIFWAKSELPTPSGRPKKAPNALTTLIALDRPRSTSIDLDRSRLTSIALDRPRYPYALLGGGDHRSRNRLHPTWASYFGPSGGVFWRKNHDSRSRSQFGGLPAWRWAPRAQGAHGPGAPRPHGPGGPMAPGPHGPHGPGPMAPGPHGPRRPWAPNWLRYDIVIKWGAWAQVATTPKIG